MPLSWICLLHLHTFWVRLASKTMQKNRNASPEDNMAELLGNLPMPTCQLEKCVSSCNRVMFFKIRTRSLKNDRRIMLISVLKRIIKDDFLFSSSKHPNHQSINSLFSLEEMNQSHFPSCFAAFNLYRYFFSPTSYSWDKLTLDVKSKRQEEMEMTPKEKPTRWWLPNIPCQICQLSYAFLVCCSPVTTEKR